MRVAAPPATAAVVTPPGEPGRSRRLSILEGCASAVHGNLVGGSLITAYAYLLGASDFHIGMISALTMLSSFGLVAGARITARAGTRKPLVTAGAIVSRLLWTPLGVIPFLPLSNSVRLTLFLAIVFMASLTLQMASNPWMSWMSDLVPERERGRYFSIRNTVCSAVGMVCARLVGRSYDLLKAAWAGHGNPAWVFVPFFSAAAIFAAGTGWVIHRQWEPPARGEHVLPLRRMMTLPLAHSAFRRLLVFLVFWSVACAIATPFFGAHMIKNLRMPMSAIATYAIYAGAVGLLAQPMWGRIMDRVGNRPVLVVNMFCVFLLPFLWLFATPSFYLPVWIDAALTGFCWPGINLAVFNMVLATAPRENQQAFLAVQGVVSGFAQFAAALLGGALAQSLAGVQWTVGPQTFLNFHVLFVISGAGRLIMILPALRLHEPDAGPMRAVVSGLAGAGFRFADLVVSGVMAGVSFVRRATRYTRIR